MQCPTPLKLALHICRKVVIQNLRPLIHSFMIYFGGVLIVLLVLVLVVTETE